MFQISEVLKKVPFFRTLGKDGIDFIVERLKFKAFDADHVICNIGDPGDKMYIIINGKVKVVVPSEAGGEENVIAVLGSGDYFGEMSLLTGEPRSASVITTEASEMFILNKSDFDVIVERFPSVTLSMGKIMSQRLRDTLKKAASKPSGAAAPTVKGNLADRSLIEILKFCENNSLNGRVIIQKGEERGEIYYEKGELQRVVLGDYEEDEALDTLLNWEEGEFIIEPRPILLEEEKAQETTGTSEKKPGRMIILNNSVVVQKVLQRAFESMGWEVYSVETAAKAQNLAKSLNPDIIISDTKLPDAMGRKIATLIREVSTLPVVFLTEPKERDALTSETRDLDNLYFTNSAEVGEVVKIVENLRK